MKTREAIIRFGPWAVPLMILLASVAVERRVAPTPTPPSRFEILLEGIRPRAATLTAKDLAARLARAERPLRLLDVREDSEWASGHLPGATHLSKGLIERDIEKLVPDPAAEIVLYCENGERALLAAENLRRMGYTNAFSLEGGYRAWLAAQPSAKMTKP